MKKLFVFACSIMTILSSAAAQKNTLPLQEFNITSVSAKIPLVFYITGDGGFNKFSTGLCNTISAAGYGIAALSAKSYFDDKKTPEETVKAIVEFLSRQFSNRPNQQLILAAYSFGSDVMPFIVNRLPVIYKTKLISVVMVAPSTSTDFETHWSDIFGSNTKRSMDVVAELNSMSVPRAVTIFGADEKDFPVDKIKIKNYTNISLPGGHHFDGNTGEVAKTMMQYFK